MEPTTRTKLGLDVAAMVEAYKLGESTRDIAARLGISQSSVQRRVRGLVEPRHDGGWARRRT